MEVADPWDSFPWLQYNILCESQHKKSEGQVCQNSCKEMASI